MIPDNLGKFVVRFVGMEQDVSMPDRGGRGFAAVNEVFKERTLVVGKGNSVQGAKVCKRVQMCKQLSREREMPGMRWEGASSARTWQESLSPPGSRSGAFRAVTGSVNTKTRAGGDDSDRMVSGWQRPVFLQHHTGDVASRQPRWRRGIWGWLHLSMDRYYPPRGIAKWMWSEKTW